MSCSRGPPSAQIQAVIDRMVGEGFDVHRSTGVMHTVLGGVGGKVDVDPEIFEVMEGVKEAHRIASPYKLASRNFNPGGTVVKIGERGDRRPAGGGDGRAVQRGEPRTDRLRGGAGGARGRPRDSRRRIQAALVAVQLSGLGRGRPANDARGGRPPRPAGGKRGDGSDPDPADGRVRRTFCRWARATCRISTCCASSASCASRCC